MSQDKSLESHTSVFSSSKSNLMLEFVSYDGAYPNLCKGRLVLRDKITNKYYYIDNALSSGGKCVYKGEDLECDTLHGPWFVEDNQLPFELLPYVNVITELVNANVELGCCGGCSYFAKGK